MPTLFSSKVMVRLELPEALYEAYERHGSRSAREPEAEMLERLKRCKDHVANRPLYFNDAQRSELEHLSGGHITKSPDALIKRLANACSIEVGDVKITIDQRLAQRLSTRVFRGQTIEGNIKKVVIEALERDCGMRP